MYRFHTTTARLFIKSFKVLKKNSINENVLIINFYYSFLEHVLIINDVPRLIIYDATTSDSNVYICRAFNEAGVTERHYNVTVKGEILLTNVIPPVGQHLTLIYLFHVHNTVNVTNPIANESLVVNELDDVHLRCPLPDMNYQWLKV